MKSLPFLLLLLLFTFSCKVPVQIQTSTYYPAFYNYQPEAVADSDTYLEVLVHSITLTTSHGLQEMEPTRIIIPQGKTACITFLEKKRPPENKVYITHGSTRCFFFDGRFLVFDPASNIPSLEITPDFACGKRLDLQGRDRMKAYIRLHLPEKLRLKIEALCRR